MRFAFLVFLAISTALAQAPAKKASFYRLKQVKIIDDQGFGQPVEVAHFLIPADWKTEGGVRWDGSQLRCPANIVQIQYRAVSPDGLSGLEITPGYVWQAASDPMMQQIIQRAAASGTGCDPGPVIGSAAYLRQIAVPRLRPNARIVSAEALPAVTQAKTAALNQVYGPLVRAGSIRGFQIDAAAVRLQYQQNGQPVDEWMTVNVATVAMPSANTAALMQGQMNMSASTYTMMSEGTFSVRAPAGKFDEKLAATIIASVRPNPQYQAAISAFLSNMNVIAQKGAMDRARIWRDAGQQISATISQSYQNQQAVQDRTAQQFSQAIRGVETYVNPSTGTQVELTGGYDNAWVNPRGEYLLSDSPGFNAAVALQENWTQLKKAR